MKLMKTCAASVLTLGLFYAGSASALVMFDQNVTPDVIFGTGNANGSFTVDTANGIELGLRAKLRYDAAGLPQNVFNSNGNGTYSFDSGVAPTQSFPTAIWNFEWTVNTNLGNTGLILGDLTYLLSLDTDPGAGTTFIAGDPINVLFADHAIGTNATGNGGGTVANTDLAYADLIANNNVAQNSWNPGLIPGFDPTAAGVYDIKLAAFSPGGDPVASTSIQVIVGGASVPAPASFLLLCTGLLVVGWRRKLDRK